MSDANSDAFPAGIDFLEVLNILSKEIYDTPFAFLRENVQNAVDAIRLAAHRRGISSDDPSLTIQVRMDGREVEIRDDGIGMSREDLQRLFWTIGASGKRTQEAQEAGCVGRFGIGGFANFGVCDELEVISRASGQYEGYRTKLSRTDIEKLSEGQVPLVTGTLTDELDAPGTIVRGLLATDAQPKALRSYLADFVRHARERIYFDGELISQVPLEAGWNEAELHPVDSDTSEVQTGHVTIQSSFFEDEEANIYARLGGMNVGNAQERLQGVVRFESGSLQVLKRGFMICSTTVPSMIGLSGTIDSDGLSPTAGRDSLNPESQSLLKSLAAALEQAAVMVVLDSSDRIAGLTRVFKYVRKKHLVAHIGKTPVVQADGSPTTLERVRARAGQGVRVYFAQSENRNLAEVLQAKGDAVVKLPGDHHKAQAIRDYLKRYCSAVPLEGRVECTSIYEDLSRFERAFLAELEETILSVFETRGVKIVPGILTEDVPVFAADEVANEPLVIYVDVRHPEITKLAPLGITSLFSSMVSAFCRQYLSDALRSRSPKFFGSGAVNLDFLAKRRAELWLLMTDEVHTVRKGSQRQVMRGTDIQVVSASRLKRDGDPSDEGKEPKLVLISGSAEFEGHTGYYLRIPAAATHAFGDVIQGLDHRMGTWVGNRVTLVASDSVSTAFHYEIRLDRLIGGGGDEHVSSSGACQLERPIHGLFGGLYFPIPRQVEGYLVPGDDEEVPIEVWTEWVDFSSTRIWQPKDSSQARVTTGSSD